jgi:hypothetical protein
MAGSKAILLVTAPAHPASKARLIIAPVAVGGAEANTKGFINLRPANSTLRSAILHLLDN